MRGREKGKITISNALKQMDSDLYKRLEAIWVIARELQERQWSKEGHQQGPLHCSTVEKNLDKIIPDDKKCESFSPLELFLFSTAACYHDIGKSVDFKEEHGVVAMKEIFDFPENFGLTKPEGCVLSFIIGSHDTDEVFDAVPEIYPVGNEDVNVRILSALFRLADVLHTDHSRIPHIIVRDAKKEDEKTRFRRLITGWTINKESQIELTAVPENHDDLNIIEKGVSMMRKQIECIEPILHEAGYPYRISIKYDNRKLKWEAEKGTRQSLLEMDYYTEDDAAIFKGRDTESRELMNKVMASNICLLIGNSGVGKTSLIRAGLFPILKKMGWKCIWTRPLNPYPLKGILEDINVSFTEGFLSNDIVSGIKKLDEDYESGVLIAIDQFEDIIRSLPHEMEQMGKILRRISSKSFRNVHVLLSYRGDYEPEIFSFLEKASIIHPEKYSLRGFDKPVASQVLRNIFRDNNIGIDDVLLGRILDELDKKSENRKIYPPFIQIIAKNLIELANSNDGVVAEELYNNTGGVENIIGSYLVSQLEYFSALSTSKGKYAEAILKQLVRDGAKEQRGKYELLRYLEIPENELSELLDEMVKERLIRHLGNNNYEIIHDFLASSVEELIKDDERPLRSAIETLRTKTLSYEHIPSLLDKNELVSIYSWKGKIKPSIPQKELLMFSYLAGNGPAWWWFKDDKDVLHTYIKKGLSNRSENVRRAAVVAFQKLGTHDDLEIIKNMLNDDYWSVRNAAASALEKFLTHDDLPLIKEMLENDDSVVRHTAASVLEKLGTYDDLKIIKSMLKDNDQGVRHSAVLALGKLGNHEDLPLIKEVLYEDSEDSDLEFFGIKSAAGSAFENFVTHDDLPLIKEMLEDDDWDVRRTAASAFEKIATHDDFQLIKEMLKDHNSNVRWAAVSALEKLGTKDGVSLIEEMLEDYDSNVRCAAVSALEKLGTHDDLTLIKEMIEDNDQNVKHAALSAFKKLVTHDDLPIIKQMLQDNDSFVRSTVISALEKLGTHEDLALIEDMLDDDDAFSRRLAVSLFEKLGTYEDLPIIKEMLHDNDFEVKDAAVSALGKLGTHKDLPVIKEMLQDNDSDVRGTAVLALEKLVTHDDLPIINEILQNDHNDVRRAAVWVFEKLGTHEDLPMINEMLQDNYSDVRISAFSVFEKFSNESELNEITEKIAQGKIINDEISLNCLISLDEKFYSPKKDVLLLHEKNPWK